MAGEITPSNSAFWIGQNGNVYLKNEYGVTDLGAMTANSLDRLAGNVDSAGGSVRGSRWIPDPNVPADSTPAPTGGASSAPLNQVAVNNTQSAIDQIPGLLEAALRAENQSHANTVAGFDSQQGQQQKTYDDSTVTNQQNYDGNFMDSIRAGIHGLGGLVNLLRGTGAAGGTAENQVHDVVGGVTANDIRNGADTQQTNQTSLDAALSSFLTELKGKRQAAEDTFANNQGAIRRDSDTQLQDLYGKMAGYYGDAGNTDRANELLTKAGSYTPEIAANSKSVVSPYNTTPVVIHAPNLTAFAPPSQPDVATIPKDGQVGSGIFTMNRKKEPQTAPLALPVGA